MSLKVAPLSKELCRRKDIAGVYAGFKGAAIYASWVAEISSIVQENLERLLMATLYRRLQSVSIIATMSVDVSSAL